jgi:predicted NUDIX family NTP pyrophosphohydrolase
VLHARSRRPPHRGRRGEEIAATRETAAKARAPSPPHSAAAHLSCLSTENTSIQKRNVDDIDNPSKEKERGITIAVSTKGTNDDAPLRVRRLPWSRRDAACDGAWSIPKGLIGADEASLLAARREFAEETGYLPDGDFLPLGEALHPRGKVVQAGAIEGDWDPALIPSNTFEIEWPPRSGRRRTFPEIDRTAWFGIADARRKILKGQIVFVDRLLESAMAVCRDDR